MFKCFWSIFCSLRYEIPKRTRTRSYKLNFLCYLTMSLIAQVINDFIQCYCCMVGTIIPQFGPKWNYSRLATSIVSALNKSLLWRSPFRRQTRSRPSMCRRQNRLSSENVTVRHSWLFHLTWLRANWRRAALCLWERQGFLAGTRDLSPAAWSRFRMVWTETGMLPAPRCCRIRLVVVGALVKGFLSVVLVTSRSSARFVALGLPERGRSLTSPDAA